MRDIQPFIIGVLSILALTISFPLGASAKMALDKVIVDFDGQDSKRSDIEVTNSDKQPMYVSVETSEIRDPGLANEKRVQFKDPKKLGLLVSPTRLVLDPGQTKTIRLSLLQRPQDSDRIYRVKIHPALGRTVATRSGLRVVVGYDVLVIARPAASKMNIVAERQGRQLRLKNAGNTNVLLLNGRQCRKDGECVDLPPRRLYAGATWSLTLPLDRPARYLLRSGEQFVEKEY